MTGPERSESPAKDEGEGFQNVLSIIAKRLRSQPMLFGLGVLVVIAIVAGTLRDRFTPVMYAALGIFVLALAAWLVVEILTRRTGARTRNAPTGTSVDVTAKGVKQQGSVVGIEGLPTRHDAPRRVNVSGKGIEGKVAGVRYAPPPSEGEAGNDTPGTPQTD